MIRRAILAIIALIMIVTGSAMLAYGQKIDVDIKTEDDIIKINENYIMDILESDIIKFWLQKGHSDVVITVNNTIITYLNNNNLYSINISHFDITSQTNIRVTYNLKKDTDVFEKKFQYDADLLTINYDGNELYTGTNLTVGSSINLVLQKDVPSPTIDYIPIWIYIVIIILLFFLLIFFIGFIKKQKSITKKDKIGGSEELFTTKKSLLMETLKEIEKRHRSNQISDDTYHKLKVEFKQDAVEAMRQLEELNK